MHVNKILLKHIKQCMFPPNLVHNATDTPNDSFVLKITKSINFAFSQIYVCLYLSPTLLQSTPKLPASMLLKDQLNFLAARFNLRLAI